MSVEISVGGVIKTVLEVKAGVSGVVKNVSGGYCRRGGVSYKFFEELGTIDSVEMRVSSISAKTYSASGFTVQNNPTSYGYTNYVSGTDKYASIWLSKSGLTEVYGYNGGSAVLNANLYAIFSNGDSISFESLPSDIISSISMQVNLQYIKSGSGDANASVKILGYTLPVTTSTIRRVVQGISNKNPPHVYIRSSIVDQTVESLRVSMSVPTVIVDDTSYPVSIVL